EHFVGLEPSEPEMDAWVTGLVKDASHLFTLRRPAAPDDDEALASTPAAALGWPEEVYAKASPETKLAAWRALQAGTGEEATHGRDQRRPRPLTLTPAQQTELAALPAMQRLTAYRALQQQAHQG